MLGALQSWLPEVDLRGFSDFIKYCLMALFFVLVVYYRV